MTVDGSHEGCFVHASRLYAVPSDSTFTVDETRSSYVDAAAVRRRGRVRVHWSAFVGGVVGGGFIDLSAWHTSKVTDWVALAMMFALGGVVGFATAIGIREALVGRPPEPNVVRLPAIEVPGDVALAAPDDATADELVLWSVITRRFRAAKVAVDSLPFEKLPLEHDQGTVASGSHSATLTPAATQAMAELTYVTARHDFEPVAELLGLSLPR
ncbi:hypothetical protein GCM10025867_28770 [Frondihabitans sucicola]|uniref:Uncharacterized protein n=1 Tax=Frondihabitans sucicola TaxID=1268041 RepID=A0ABM8GQB7_9MICO|nr:hypothetical protein [Frondihabitans sucicola]BDZ50636.1 hypothetical protein GCM10025867_28770 [Frondihabitans sucicola]